MTYLLAQFTLLFLLTAATAFMFGRWWSRRNCVEVTESFQSLLQSQREQEADSWDKLFNGLESLKEVTVAQVRSIPQPVIPEFDLSGLDERITALSGQVTALPQPERVDLSIIQAELKHVSDAVANIRIPAPSPQVDLKPLERQLTELDSSIRSIPRPEAAQTVSLDDTNERLSAIEKALRTITSSKSAPEPAPAPPPAMGSANRLLKAPAVKDELQRISGVGPMLERLLNDNGIYCFWQIAGWTPSNIQEMDDRLDVFKGRISRDDWPAQASRFQQDSPAKPPPA